MEIDSMEEKTLKEPVGGYRFQVIGLELKDRNEYLAACKLNNESGSEVIKRFMKNYITDNARSA